ncbi:hypothetical protein V3474_29290, partial [Pseudomonas aeruginosa]
MELQLDLVFQTVTLVVLVLVLAADLLIILARPHIPSPKESALWVVFYVVLALAFAGILVIVGGGEVAG